MRSDPSLAEVWKVYEVTKDCLKVTNRALRSDNEKLVGATNFVGSTRAETEAWIKNCHEETDRAVIVLLWTHFEIIIANFVQTQIEKLPETEFKTSAKKLVNKNGRDIERWKIGDVLDLLKDLLKGELNPKRLGDAKNIKKYRDWVAHRNPKNLPPSQTDPKTAYPILSGILDVVQKTIEQTQGKKGAPAAATGET